MSETSGGGSGYQRGDVVVRKLRYRENGGPVVREIELPVRRAVGGYECQACGTWIAPGDLHAGSAWRHYCLDCVEPYREVSGGEQATPAAEDVRGETEARPGGGDRHGAAPTEA